VRGGCCRSPAYEQDLMWRWRSGRGRMERAVTLTVRGRLAADAGPAGAVLRMLVAPGRTIPTGWQGRHGGDAGDGKAEQ